MGAPMGAAGPPGGPRLSGGNRLRCSARHGATQAGHLAAAGDGLEDLSQM